METVSKPVHGGADDALRNPAERRSTDLAPLAYSPSEAARAVGISRAAMYIEVAEGRIAARKLGRRTLIPAAELARWLDELPTREPV